MVTNRRRLAASAIVALSVSALTLVGSGAASAAAPHAASGYSSAVSATAPASAKFSLPAPTGHYEAGEDVLHLTDTGRLDPWNPSAGYRQLTVSMFYPARQGTGQPAPYMSAGEAQGFVSLRVPPGFGITADPVAAMQTHAFTGAKAAPGKFPLIVLSPGLENPRATLTSLATDLASRGYVVALVGHPYEDSGEQLADGSIAPCLWCSQSGPDPASNEQLVSSRAVDVKFVVDQLTAGHAWNLGHLIDKCSIGMAGHSVGGAAAAAAMEADPRIRAGVNLDGTFFPAVPAGGLGGRAFMMFGKQSDHAAGDAPDWDQTWADLTGYKRWFAVDGEAHASFTDIAVLAEEASMPVPGQSVDGFRSVQITRDYVAAFFDKTLKGIPSPLMDGDSPAYPEVAAQP
ncbi:dienelactone hydrolase [Catenulispora sp. GP43]|uniref:alpha/beta hydrolase family protein n=1 Tax=Catenulispora sp. GP43 TaxID=3156263 RepID=UPI0035132079